MIQIYNTSINNLHAILESRADGHMYINYTLTSTISYVTVIINALFLFPRLYQMYM